MDGSSFLASFSLDHDIKFDGGAIDTFPVSGSKVKDQTFLATRQTFLCEVRLCCQNCNTDLDMLNWILRISFILGDHFSKSRSSRIFVTKAQIEKYCELWMGK